MACRSGDTSCVIINIIFQMVIMLSQIQRLPASLSFCAALFVAAGAQANVVYSINTTATNVYPSGNPSQTDTVLGTITTDGTLGVLAASNILSWSLDLIDHLDGSKNFHLDPTDSEVVHVFGTALTASPTDLSFNFNQGGAEFLIQGDNRGASHHSIASGYNYPRLSISHFSVT